MEVTIERILPGGLGLAHAEAKTVMVGLAAPGDRLRVQVERVKGSVSFARILEVLTPSPQRVEPPCPYFGRCGGCDFQQLSYEAQLGAKADIIKDCLRRIGGIEQLPDFSVMPAPNPWHYRSRAQWQYDAVRRRFGYFESGSRRVCDVAECAVLVPELQESLEFLRREMQEDRLPEEARYFRAVVGEDGVAINPSVGSPNVREGLVPSASEDDVTHTIGGDTFRLNAESFFQANADLLPQLVDAALSGANGKTAIELYCGVGLFTLPLARRFTQIIAVEGDSTAAKLARDNLANARLKNAEVVSQDVGRWLEEVGSSSSTSEKRRQVAAFEDGVDFLLLDPPRTGAESRVIAGIIKLKPRQISYVSCDPATLARDLKKLIGAGYALDSATAFDMFPQTHHVETVAHLMSET